MTKIIVLNNDTAFLNLMSDLLGEEGFETTVLPVSDQAYDLVRKEQPDLVIIDIGAAGNGWTVLNLLRLDPETSNIPVIVASVDSNLLKAKAGLLREKGCEILEKPFLRDELMSKVQAALSPA